MGNSRTQTTKGVTRPPIRRFPEFVARGPVDHATEPYRDPVRTGPDSGQIGVDLGKTGVREEERGRDGRSFRRAAIRWIVVSARIARH